jgi:predicted  nucleic acid-binding Zn-ribbon protein
MQELVVLTDKTHDHESGLSELQQELANVRRQITTTEESLQAKTTELDDAHQRLRDQADEVAKSKVTCSQLYYRVTNASSNWRLSRKL